MRTDASRYAVSLTVSSRAATSESSCEILSILDRKQGQIFKDDIRGEDGGDIAVVVGRGNFDEVKADQIQAVQSAYELEQLALISPPTSGVPVPGAKAGSAESMTTVT